jgi:hypothetical protein
MRSVKAGGGVAVAVEENEAAGGVGAFSKKVDYLRVARHSGVVILRKATFRTKPAVEAG